MTAVRVLPGRAGLSGRLRVPGDKSIAHRALILAALADGPSRLTGLPDGADVRSTRSAIEALGSHVEEGPDAVTVIGGGLALGSGRTLAVDCGNSGTTMRLIAGVVAARSGAVTLRGDASLSRRPMERVARPLRAMGAAVTTESGHAPLCVRGGRLHPVEWTPEVASAQVKSAVLLAGLRTAGTTRVADGSRTRDHTERLLAYLGAAVERQGDLVTITGERRLRARDLAVPGDASSAAFWVVAASVVPGSALVLTDVGVNATRTGLLRVLARMGAAITLHHRRERAGEPWADVEVRAARLHGTVVEPDEVPGAIDELPVLAIAAACADGETSVTGAGELRAKESDRLASLLQLRDIGVDIDVHADGFRVRGSSGRPLVGGAGRAGGDHRIAMTLAIAGLVSRTGVRIDDVDVARVSYPGFLADLERCGGRVER